MVAIVALVSFDSPSVALLPPALYFVCTIVEGQFLTPALLGKRLEMNTVVVFLAVAVWGWLWGVLGALMAVPILVSLRVLCDHFESLVVAGRIPRWQGAGGSRAAPRPAGSDPSPGTAQPAADRSMPRTAIDPIEDRAIVPADAIVLVAPPAFIRTPASRTLSTCRSQPASGNQDNPGDPP